MVRLTRHAAAFLLLALYVCATAGPVVAATLRGVPVRADAADCCGALHPGKACPMAKHARQSHGARLSCGCTADELAPGGTVAAVPPPVAAATVAAHAGAFRARYADRLLDRPAPITVPPPRG